MPDLKARLDYLDAVGDWQLDQAEALLRRDDPEACMRHLSVAASVFSRQNRRLSTPRLESLLCALAQRLPESSGAPGTIASSPPSSARGCLHVMTEALPAGGLTRMATRWMRLDGSARSHSLAVLAQRAPLPETLARAVAGSGGQVHFGDLSSPLLRQAAWLRGLARGGAALVVLHVDVSDVVCAVAFGTPGGPPVVLVNHNAHLHWVGVCIADRVLDCRGSAAEIEWTVRHRGARRRATLPIPLEDTCRGPDRRAAARRALGLRPDALLLLTVGAGFKYVPVPGLDFVATWAALLERLHDAELVAVGVHEDARWRAAAARVGGRLRAVGPLPAAQLALLQDAADVYVEGFPFGTTTALLEAGLRGLPALPAPAACPPPYGTDGVALDGVLRPARDAADYERRAMALCTDVVLRLRQGALLRRAILAHHAGPAWLGYLERLLAGLASEHAVCLPAAPEPTPEPLHAHGAAIATRTGPPYEAALENAVLHAFALSLRPRAGPALLAALDRHAAVRRGHAVAAPLLRVLLGAVLDRFPPRLAATLFRVAASLSRGARIERLRARLSRRPASRRREPQPYGEYRDMPATETGVPT